MSKRKYNLCPECDQPMLRKNQRRKHPGDYRHAQGCPLDDVEMKPITNTPRER